MHFNLQGLKCTSVTDLVEVSITESELKFGNAEKPSKFSLNPRFLVEKSLQFFLPWNTLESLSSEV